jgi:hypothetical protein
MGAILVINMTREKNIKILGTSRLVLLESNSESISSNLRSGPFPFLKLVRFVSATFFPPFIADKEFLQFYRFSALL